MTLGVSLREVKFPNLKEFSFPYKCSYNLPEGEYSFYPRLFPWRLRRYYIYVFHWLYFIHCFFSSIIFHPLFCLQYLVLYQTCTNLLSLVTFDVCNKDWLTYSDETDRTGNTIHTSLMTLLSLLQRRYFNTWLWCSKSCFLV